MTPTEELEHLRLTWKQVFGLWTFAAFAAVIAFIWLWIPLAILWVERRL